MADEHLKKKGRRHGPVIVDRPSRYTAEERRAISLARCRKHYAKSNAKRKQQRIQKRLDHETK